MWAQIRDVNGNYIAIGSRGNLFLTWTPGQDYWVPHNRGSSRRIQNMGFIGNDVKNGIWMTLNGGALLVSSDIASYPTVSHGVLMHCLPHVRKLGRTLTWTRWISSLCSLRARSTLGATESSTSAGGSRAMHGPWVAPALFSSPRWPYRIKLSKFLSIHLRIHILYVWMNGTTFTYVVDYLNVTCVCVCMLRTVEMFSSLTTTPKTSRATCTE